MDNFLSYIEEDIKSKKLLLSSMPIKTKTNKRNYNKKIDEILNTYSDYEKIIKKYMVVKSKSFEVADTKNTEKVTEQIAVFENIRFILNPLNTYFEKIGFDTLFHQLDNSKEINFVSLNNIFNEFIDKFEMVNIKLTKENFNYTYYVNQFMSVVLDTRAKKGTTNNHLTETFETLYWENPQLISHVGLNFKQLIRKNEKKFVEYVNKLKEEIHNKNHIDYEDCLNRLAVLYQELHDLSKENVADIIKMGKSGDVDVNHFFEDSKVRTITYESLMLDSLKPDNEEAMKKFYESLSKLKANVKEYSNYVKFAPLINNFKTKYLNKEGTGNNKNDLNKKLKEQLSVINKKEKKLVKINDKLFGKFSKIIVPKEEDIKNCKIESVKQANELCDLYQTYNEDYFNSKVSSIISTNFSLKDLLYLYYSFDYYKKDAIKNSFEIETYEELVEYSENFDLFALDLTKVIVCNVNDFNEETVAKVIINKYRLLNINVTNEDLFPENISDFLERVNLILRIKELEDKDMSTFKLWFIIQVNKIIAANIN